MFERINGTSRVDLVSASSSTIRPTTSSIPQREQILIDTFNTYIQIGVGTLLFLLGLTFNCLSLIYFRFSKSFRQTSFQLYFSIISLLDTVRLFEFFVFLLFDKGYLKVTLTLCRLVFFSIMFTGQASIWLTVALALEKCIIIWFPIKGRLCFTMSISRMVLIVVLIIVLLADVIYLLPTFFLDTYENVSIHTFMCVWQTGSNSSGNALDQWKKHYFTFNTIFFQSIIPSIMLLLLNWLILFSLSKQRRDLKKIGSIDSKNNLKREKQFKEKTIQLVLSSFFVIVTVSPRYILTMVYAFANTLSKGPIMPFYIFVNLNMTFRVLEMSNYSLNMIFAIISGRTSRLEIRKYIADRFLWRFKRTESTQRRWNLSENDFVFSEAEQSPVRASVHSRSVTLSNLISGRIKSRSSSTAKTSSDRPTRWSIRSASRSTIDCCGMSVDLSSKRRPSDRSRSTNTNSSFNDRRTRPTACAISDTFAVKEIVERRSSSQEKNRFHRSNNPKRHQLDVEQISHDERIRSNEPRTDDDDDDQFISAAYLIETC